MQYKIINIRDNPDYLTRMVDYYVLKWNLNKEIWHNLISDCISTQNALPRWYLMVNNENEIIGCIGIMTDDVSKENLKPNIAGLYVEENMRSMGLGAALLEHAQKEANKLGFPKLYLTTYHKGYFEKYGWKYLEDKNTDSEGKVRNYVIDTIQ